MFPDSLATGGWFSSHWTVVLVVALLFFAVQVALSLRISRSLRRQERLLGRLCRDLAHGGDGRPAVDALPGSFAWLEWVLTIFPAKSATPPGSYTRDSVLQELDTRLDVIRVEPWTAADARKWWALHGPIGTLSTIAGQDLSAEAVVYAKR